MQGEEQALLMRIQADPTDLITPLVYADWLEDRSDPRAEFVRALVACATGSAPRKHQARLRELRKHLDPLWLAAVGDTPARLRTIARVLDAREGADTFEYVKSLVAYGDFDPHLRSPDSCLTVRHAGTLLDLEVCAHATDHTWRAHLDEDLDKSPEGIRDVGEFISGPEVAPAVRSLYLWTTVAGNGAAVIRLDGYLYWTGEFSNLKQFGTNFSNEDGECIIASHKGHGYEEGGVIAEFLARCPVVEELTLPSAPNDAFFRVGPRPIKTLNVKAGFVSTQDFILNLSRSSCFPTLETLVYEEDNPSAGGTPFDHFAELLRSPALNNARRVEIRCPSLREAEVRRLRAIRGGGVKIRR
jgi:uncharacterized protein (TIGR02996 family)